MPVVAMDCAPGKTINEGLACYPSTKSIVFREGNDSKHKGNRNVNKEKQVRLRSDLVFFGFVQQYDHVGGRFRLVRCCLF